MVYAARSSLAVALFSLALTASALVGACSGGEFSEAGPSAGGSAGGGGMVNAAGSGPSAGSGATPGGTMRCAGPADCDDLNPCTIDECGLEGTCEYSPKCADGERCCDGTCGQCCAQEDCVDGVSCTTDQCFNLFCAYVPDDGSCGANQYCHGTDGCKDKEPCPNGTTAECDDGDACTEDSCSGGFCEHKYCSLNCCPDGSCAECCGDGQCPNEDGDLCTQEACQDGRCQTSQLCSDGALCCEGADHASCGACCVPDDCDDGVACTDENCLAGECSHTANDENCEDNEICDLEQGCVPVAMCQEDADCVSADKCQTGACVDGFCTFTGCANNLTCCPGVGCRTCCDNSQCAGGFCCDGVCQQCCTRYDCPAQQMAPAPLPGDCESRQCFDGVCQYTWDICDFAPYCCAPYGCSIELCAY